MRRTPSLAAAAAIIGPKRVERAHACRKALIDLFAHSGMTDACDETFDISTIVLDQDTTRLVPRDRRKRSPILGRRRCSRPRGIAAASPYS